MGDMTQLGRARVLALDALVAIVSNQNPVEDISVLELSEIYSGKLNNWKELGPQEAAITPYLRDIETGSGAVALQRFCSKKTKHLEAKHGFQLITLICHSACLSTLSGSGLSGVQRHWTPRSLHSQGPVAAL